MLILPFEALKKCFLVARRTRCQFWLLRACSIHKFLFHSCWRGPESLWKYTTSFSNTNGYTTSNWLTPIVWRHGLRVACFLASRNKRKEKMWSFLPWRKRNNSPILETGQERKTVRSPLSVTNVDLNRWTITKHCKKHPTLANQSFT